MKSTKAADRLLDETFVALADRTRRAILRRLIEGDARVTSLAQLFPISLNSVSKHIKLLERARLVSRRKIGREQILSYRPASLEKIQEWISTQERFWKAGLVALETAIIESDPITETEGRKGT
jgi:DNA-binding transcriptional ArsR family regulator